MATSSEFEELLAMYQKEKDGEKRADLLQRMRENVRTRNNGKEEFLSLHTNKTITISHSDCAELINISRNLETIDKKELCDELNSAIRNSQLSRNKYTKDNPYGK